MARPAGVEPATTGLEGRCSIQLSYGRTVRNGRLPYTRLALIGWSGQQDSNLRPSAPKADALPDCAMPRSPMTPIRGLPKRARRTGARMIRSHSGRVNLIARDHPRGSQSATNLARGVRGKEVLVNARDLA